MAKSKSKIAIIGTSPICLFEAIYQAIIGNEVVIFDRLDRVGGAWANINYTPDYNLEVGCHIWDVNRKTYAFIEQFLKCKLKPLSPKPVIIYKNKTFPYDWKNNFLIIKALIHDFKGYVSGKKFIKPIIKPRNYKYPPGGSKQLVDRLLLRVNELNIQLQLNSKIDFVSQEKTGWQVSANNKFHSFNRIILTSLSHIEEIRLMDRHIKPNYLPNTFYHYLLVIKNSHLTDSLSYVRVMDHKFIHRISDISGYSSTKERIISVGVFKDRLKEVDDKEITERIRKYLIKKGFLEEKAEISAVFNNEFITNTINHFEIKELKRINNLKILRSTNFIYGLANNVDRWSIRLCLINYNSRIYIHINNWPILCICINMS